MGAWPWTSRLICFLTTASWRPLAPHPLWQQNGGTDLALRSELDLDVDTDGPRFTGDAQVGLIPSEDAPRLGMDLEFGLAREADPGLAADLDIHMDKTPLLRGSVLWPGRADLQKQAWIPDPDRGLEVTVPDQELDLSLLGPYLPADFSVTGAVSLGLALRQAGGSAGLADLVGTSEVEGHLGLQDLKVELPHRSRVAVQADLAIAGKLEDPRLEGEIIIPSGFFRLPEIPPSLLPKQGDSYLWTAMAEADSLKAAFRPGRTGADSTAATLPLIPDLDLRVRVPGRLVLSGLGLNAELEGDVRVQRGQDRKGQPAPVLTGEMGLVDGSFKFMNHVFRPERTAVRFHGEAPPNPMLDLLMAADVSGYRIILEVIGLREQAPDRSAQPAHPGRDGHRGGPALRAAHQRPGQRSAGPGGGREGSRRPTQAEPGCHGRGLWRDRGAEPGDQHLEGGHGGSGDGLQRGQHPDGGQVPDAAHPPEVQQEPGGRAGPTS